MSSLPFQAGLLVCKTKVPYPIHDEIYNQVNETLFLDGDSILALNHEEKEKCRSIDSRYWTEFSHE